MVNGQTSVQFVYPKKTTTNLPRKSLSLTGPRTDCSVKSGMGLGGSMVAPFNAGGRVAWYMPILMTNAASAPKKIHNLRSIIIRLLRFVSRVVHPASLETPGTCDIYNT